MRAAVSNDGSGSFDVDWEAELGPRTDGTEFLVAQIDDRPIGALQIIDPATERTRYRGDVGECLRAVDIWIGEASFLARGDGTRMMRFAIERCFAAPDVRAIVIDPLANNVRAHRFHRRLGFEFVERRTFDETSDCHVFRLDRTDSGHGRTRGAPPPGTASGWDAPRRPEPDPSSSPPAKEEPS